MNDYAALKLAHLRREQAARLQRDDAFRDALKEDAPEVKPLPSLRLRIERLLPRPLRPTPQAPLRRAIPYATLSAPPC